MVHGDGVHAPSSLMDLTPLMVKDRLTDFSALRGAVTNRLHTGDGLLHYYAGNWWTHFTTSTERYPQSVQDVLRFWKQQLCTLPIPLSLPPPEDLNVNGMTNCELFEAYAVGQDCLFLLNKEIDKVLVHLNRVTKSVANMRRLKHDLATMEQNKLAEEEEDARNEAMSERVLPKKAVSGRGPVASSSGSPAVRL